MIKSLEIENFRCFHQSYFDGFERINLIGGKNNAGKTTLLEALLLSIDASEQNFNFLQQIRLENSSAFRFSPELAWGNLFYDFDKKKPLRITAVTDKGVLSTNVECQERSKSELLADPTSSNNWMGKEELVKITDNATLGEVGESLLKVAHSINDKGPRPSVFGYRWQGDIVHSVRRAFVYLYSIDFMPSGFKRANSSIARGFMHLKAIGQKQVLLDILRILEPNIRDVDTIQYGGELRLHLLDEQGKYRPANYYGDAMVKVIDLVLRICSNPEIILLVDEIENGIHYTHHRDFWKMLFKITEMFKVQIFATSHSGEMIQAFKDIAQAPENEAHAGYFELYKDVRINEIVSNKIALDTLEYSIQTNHPYRGE